MQKRLGLYTKSLVLLVSPIIVYWNELKLLYNEAVNHDLLTHILIIPFLIAFLLYREKNYIKTVFLLQTDEKEERKAILETVSGIILFLLALMIKLFGSLTFYSLEYHAFSLPIFVSGLTLILFGFEALKALYFPIFMLLFLVPPPLLELQRIGSYLATYSAIISYNAIKITGIPVVLSMDYDSPIIYLTTRTGESVPFAIDVGCSGIYSLIGFIIFATFISYISKGSVKNKILVFLSGVPILYLFNIVRIILLLTIGYLYNVNYSLNVFHFLGGWTLIFVGTVLMLTISERVFNLRIFSTTINTCKHDYHDLHCIHCGKIRGIGRNRPTKTSSKDYIKILSISLVTVLLFNVKIPIFTLTEVTSDIRVDEFSSLEQPISVLPPLSEYDLSFVYRDKAFENLSGQDASLMYIYQPQDRNSSEVWVALEIATTKGVCHLWESCLITYRRYNPVTQVDLRDIQLSDDPPTSARYFAYIDEDVDYVQVILYWYTRSIFKTGTGFEEKWAKISLIQYVDERNQVHQAEMNLLPLAETIFEYWQPVYTWSHSVLSIARDGVMFIKILLTGLTGVVVYALFLYIEQRRTAQKLYLRITDKADKEIIKAIKSLANAGTETRIKDKLMEQAGIEMDIDTLIQKLENAKSIGLIRDSVVKIDDEPRLTWKTML